MVTHSCAVCEIIMGFGGFPTERFHNMESILFTPSFSSLHVGYHFFCYWNPFCRGFSNPFTFLSSSQHYHAKEFDVGCPTAVATLRFAWSLLSSLAPSQMIRRAVGRCLSRQQGSSWLLASTPISTSSSLGTSLWGKRSNIYPPFTKGACKSLLGYLHFLQLCSWTLVVPFFLPHRLEWYQLG